MNSHQIEAMLTLTAEIARLKQDTKLYEIPRGVAKLQRLAASLHKRYEAACSYEWANTEAYEKRTDQLEKKALMLAAELCVGLEIQRDPRGWPFIFNTGERETRLG